MIRDGILKTKRHELGNVVANRKRKLRELYHATVAFAGPEESGRHVAQNENRILNEATFLDANDLSKSRYFDVNTLLRIRSDLNSHIRSSGATSARENGTATSSLSTDNVVDEDSSAKAKPSPIHDAQAHGKPGQHDLAASPKIPLSERVSPNPSNATTAFEIADTDRMEGVLANVVLQRDDTSGIEAGPRRPLEAVALDFSNQLQPQSQLGQRQVRSGRSSSSEDLAMCQTAKAHDNSTRALDVLSHEQKGPPESSLGPSQPIELSTVTPPANQGSGPSAQLQLEAANSSQYSTKPSASREVPEIDKVGKEAIQAMQLASNDLGVPRSEALGSSLALRRSPSGRSTADRKSPMRIDTDTSRHTSIYNTQASSDSTTPLRSDHMAMQTSPPERMATRNASGVLRHKSVSEILGEAPRSALGKEKGSPCAVSNELREIGTQTPFVGRLVASPESATFRSRLNELKEREKDRSKLSAVVFPRQQLSGGRATLKAKPDDVHRKEKAPEPKDYLVTLFATQATAQTPTLPNLIASSSKVLDTDNHYLEYRETQDTRMLKRIYHLQNSNRWSLRQMERSSEPERPVSHWDLLLGEAKWMRTDFREERKWKIAAAKNLADWCAEWFCNSPEKRMALQVKPQKSAQLPNEDNRITPVSLPIANGSSHSETTPDLIPSTADDASDIADDEVPSVDMSRSIAPGALFTLAPEDVVFSMHHTPSADKLLEELPMYEVYKDVRGKKRPYSVVLDSEWKQPLVPVTKFATGKMVMKEQGPLRKRSRYDYEEEDEIGHDPSGRTLLPLVHGKDSLVPEKDNVALFNPESKHIISRLHASHAFRPPSEFNMPSQAFFESRTPSQWTVAEDDQLRRLVRDYEYNWSLIAASCSSSSLFSSAAERRTPWECFERWVSFEGLPGGMGKHQYFRTWNTRRDSAKEHLENSFNAQQQSSNTSQTAVRRRTAEPIMVGQRRQTKHVTLVHSMFKLAKKREAAHQKQQHIASLATMRKATEPTQPRQRMQTPRELSAHKHKQECEYREKQMLYRQQLVATQRAAVAQKMAAQQAGAQSTSGMPQVSRSGLPTQPNGVGNNPLSSLPPNGMPPGNRGIPHPAAMADATPSSNPGASNQTVIRGVGNVPQASMQPYMSSQQRLSTHSGQDRIVLEAARLQQEQQRLMQQQQQRQQQQQVQSNGLNGLPSTSYNGNMNMPLQQNAAMLANMQAANGKLSPATNGTSNQSRSSASPGIGGNMQSQQMPSGVYPVLNQISNHLKARHPGASPEQIKQMATTQLSQQLRNIQQTNSNNMAMNSNVQLSPQQQMAFSASANANMMNPQLYAQYVRSHQATQQPNRNGPTGGGGGGGGGSHDEANGIRPGSQGSVGNVPSRRGSMPNGASPSPRPPQAQMAGSSS